MRNAAQTQKNTFESICVQHGLKITPQRLAVYNELALSRKHPSVDEVYANVRKILPNISFDTVYRTIGSFVDKGIIRVVESHSGVKRFDQCTTDHHHLHCIKCHKIIDFNNKDYDKLEFPKEIHPRFKALYKRVVIEGICSECSTK